MKKLFSLLLAAVMLFACAAVSAKPEAKPLENTGVRLEGYIVGNKGGAAVNEWIGFYSDDLSQYDIYSSMDISYGAAYYNGYVYGYLYGYDSSSVLHSDFYRISINTRTVEFIDGASAGGEFVYGMAYNYTDNTMYALCNENNPYIASVDLATGELTRVLTVDLDSSNFGMCLGLQTFAIDSNGDFLALTFSATSARLVKIDKANGSLTALLNTGMDTFYAQSMTYDHATNKIYWAHSDTNYSYKNGVYSIDMNDYTVTYLGTFETDLELTCLYAIDDYSEPQPVNTYTVTFMDGLTSTVIGTVEVEEGSAASAPAAPEHEGYEFIGWDADFSCVTSDMTVTALYQAVIAAGLLGDVDCNGTVDMSDVSMLFSHLNGGSAAITAQGMLNADANQDGIVSIMDISAIYGIIANS